MTRPRDEVDALEAAGLCPECRQRTCLPPCRKYWFDRGYRIGYHDGANNLERHDCAFVVEMMEDGEYGDGDDK